MLLIKRPGRAAVEPRRAWAVVSSTPGAESTTWGSYASDGELLDIPLAPVAAPCDPVDALPRLHPRTPRCVLCAPWPAGRGKARRAQARPGVECSHIGGDRFRPTCSCCRTASTTAVSTPGARSTSSRPRSGPRWWSIFYVAGRSTAAGAGGPALREARAWDVSSSTISTRSAGTPLPPATSASTWRTATSGLTVTVRPIVGAEAGLLTCKATHPLHPPTFNLEGIELHA